MPTTDTDNRFLRTKGHQRLAGVRLHRQPRLPRGPPFAGRKDKPAISHAKGTDSDSQGSEEQWNFTQADADSFWISSLRSHDAERSPTPRTTPWVEPLVPAGFPDETHPLVRSPPREIIRSSQVPFGRPALGSHLDHGLGHPELSRAFSETSYLPSWARNEKLLRHSHEEGSQSGTDWTDSNFLPANVSPLPVISDPAPIASSRNSSHDKMNVNSNDIFVEGFKNARNRVQNLHYRLEEPALPGSVISAQENRTANSDAKGRIPKHVREFLASDRPLPAVSDMNNVKNNGLDIVEPPSKSNSKGNYGFPQPTLVCLLDKNDVSSEDFEELLLHGKLRRKHEAPPPAQQGPAYPSTDQIQKERPAIGEEYSELTTVKDNSRSTMSKHHNEIKESQPERSFAQELVESLDRLSQGYSQHRNSSSLAQQSISRKESKTSDSKNYMRNSCRAVTVSDQQGRYTTKDKAENFADKVFDVRRNKDALESSDRSPPCPNASYLNLRSSSSPYVVGEGKRRTRECKDTSAKEQSWSTINMEGLPAPLLSRQDKHDFAVQACRFSTYSFEPLLDRSHDGKEENEKPSMCSYTSCYFSAESEPALDSSDESEFQLDSHNFRRRDHDVFKQNLKNTKDDSFNSGFQYEYLQYSQDKVCKSNLLRAPPRCRENGKISVLWNKNGPDPDVLRSRILLQSYKSIKANTFKVFPEGQHVSPFVDVLTPLERQSLVSSKDSRHLSPGPECKERHPVREHYNSTHPSNTQDLMEKRKTRGRVHDGHENRFQRKLWPTQEAFTLEGDRGPLKFDTEVKDTKLVQNQLGYWERHLKKAINNEEYQKPTDFQCSLTSMGQYEKRPWNAHEHSRDDNKRQTAYTDPFAESNAMPEAERSHTPNFVDVSRATTNGSSHLVNVRLSDPDFRQETFNTYSECDRYNDEWRTSLQRGRRPSVLLDSSSRSKLPTILPAPSPSLCSSTSYSNEDEIHEKDACQHICQIASSTSTEERVLNSKAKVQKHEGSSQEARNLTYSKHQSKTKNNVTAMCEKNRIPKKATSDKHCEAALDGIRLHENTSTRIVQRRKEKGREKGERRMHDTATSMETKRDVSAKEKNEHSGQEGKVDGLRKLQRQLMEKKNLTRHVEAAGLHHSEKNTESTFSLGTEDQSLCRGTFKGGQQCKHGEDSIYNQKDRNLDTLGATNTDASQNKCQPILSNSNLQGPKSKLPRASKTEIISVSEGRRQTRRCCAGKSSKRTEGERTIQREGNGFSMSWNTARSLKENTMPSTQRKSGHKIPLTKNAPSNLRRERNRLHACENQQDTSMQKMSDCSKIYNGQFHALKQNSVAERRNSNDSQFKSPSKKERKLLAKARLPTPPGSYLKNFLLYSDDSEKQQNIKTCGDGLNKRHHDARKLYVGEFPQTSPQGILFSLITRPASFRDCSPVANAYCTSAASHHTHFSTTPLVPFTLEENSCFNTSTLDSYLGLGDSQRYDFEMSRRRTERLETCTIHGIPSRHFDTSLQDQWFRTQALDRRNPINQISMAPNILVPHSSVVEEAENEKETDFGKESDHHLPSITGESFLTVLHKERFRKALTTISFQSYNPNSEMIRRYQELREFINFVFQSLEKIPKHGSLVLSAETSVKQNNPSSEREGKTVSWIDLPHTSQGLPRKNAKKRATSRSEKCFSPKNTPLKPTLKPQVARAARILKPVAKRQRIGQNAKIHPEGTMAGMEKKNNLFSDSNVAKPCLDNHQCSKQKAFPPAKLEFCVRSAGQQAKYKRKACLDQSLPKGFSEISPLAFSKGGPSHLRPPWCKVYEPLRKGKENSCSTIVDDRTKGTIVEGFNFLTPMKGERKVKRKWRADSPKTALSKPVIGITKSPSHSRQPVPNSIKPFSTLFARWSGSPSCLFQTQPRFEPHNIIMQRQKAYWRKVLLRSKEKKSARRLQRPVDTRAINKNKEMNSKFQQEIEKIFCILEEATTLIGSQTHRINQVTAIKPSAFGMPTKAREANCINLIEESEQLEELAVNTKITSKSNDSDSLIKSKDGNDLDWKPVDIKLISTLIMLCYLLTLPVPGT